jgi:hypothetical protein
MSGNDTRRDDALGALALLGAHEPDHARDARVRARCRAVLEKQRRQALAPARPRWHPGFEPAIVGALCAVYLVEVLSRALRLYRF